MRYCPEYEYHLHCICGSEAYLSDEGISVPTSQFVYSCRGCPRKTDRHDTREEATIAWLNEMNEQAFAALRRLDETLAE